MKRIDSISSIGKSQKVEFAANEKVESFKINEVPNSIEENKTKTISQEQKS